MTRFSTAKKSKFHRKFNLSTLFLIYSLCFLTVFGNSGNIPYRSAFSWGSASEGESGQPSVTTPLEGPVNIVQLSIGVNHVLALTNEGQVWGWGSSKVTPQVFSHIEWTPWIYFTNRARPHNSQFTHEYVDHQRRDDEFIFCCNQWTYVCGENTYATLGVGPILESGVYSELVENYNLTNISYIAPGMWSSRVLAIRDGLVLSWGWEANYYGSLGFNISGTNGARAYITDPTVIPSLSNIHKVFVGWDHSFALGIDGTLFCWGKNVFGECGLGHVLSPIIHPHVVFTSSTHRVKQFSGGMEHALFVNSNGEVFGWGQGVLGQLGIPEVTQLNEPTRISTISFGVSHVSAGDVHSVFIGTNGLVHVVGLNTQNRLGFTDSDSRNSPTPNGIIGVSLAMTGGSVTVCLTRKGRVIAFGKGADPRSGFLASAPRPLHFPRNLRSVVAESRHAIYQTISNEFYASGSNFFQQLGLGLDSVDSRRTTPEKIIFPPKVEVVGISTTQSFNLALSKDGDVYTFGSGRNGLGTTALTPTLISGLSEKISTIIAGTDHILLVSVTGQMSGFGANEWRQLGIITSSFSIPRLLNRTQVSFGAAGTQNSIYFTLDDRAFVAGLNGNNGLNSSSSSSFSSWTHNPFLSGLGIVKVVQGADITLGLTKQGFLHCHGGNGNGGCGQGHREPVRIPILLDLINITHISCGHTIQAVLVIQSDTLILGWGINTKYNLGLGPEGPTDSLVPVNITTIVNPVHTAMGSASGFAVNECTNGFGGMQCTERICDGYLASDPRVCSGAGICMDGDVCQCFQPSYGDQCQFGEFHWLPNSGDWLDPINWVINRDGDLVRSPIPPSEGSSVIINEEGVYTITITQNIKLKSLTIPSVSTGTKISFNGIEIHVDEFYIGKNVNVTMRNVKIDRHSGVLSNVINFGNLNFMDSIDLMNCNFTNHGTIFVLESSSTGVEKHHDDFQREHNFAMDTTPYGTIVNYGIISKNTTSSFRFACNILNHKTFVAHNIGKLNFLGDFHQTDGATLDLTNIQAEFVRQQTISGGFLTISGFVICPHLNFSSQDGFMNATDCIIQGNFSSSSVSTIYALFESTSNSLISSSQNINLEGLIILKPKGTYRPLMGSRIPFIQATSASGTQLFVKLFGSPFRNGRFHFDGKFGYFLVEFSFGTAISEGYRCHYAGNRRNLELNIYSKQQKMILSLTTPERPEKSNGFGFDVLNGILNSSWSSVASVDGAFEPIILRDHLISSTLENSPFLIIDSTRSQSIFGVGPTFHTITLMLPVGTLSTQQNFYFAEFEAKDTSAHVLTETIPFSVFGNNDTTHCTNFVEPSRSVGETPIAIGLVLGAFLVLFVVWVLLVRVRPMNTRGFGPGLTIVFLAIQVALEIRNHVEIPNYQSSLCVFNAYAVYPFQQIVYFTAFIYCLRFFSVINLNTSKVQIFKTLTSKSANASHNFLKVKTRLLKGFGSWWFVLTTIGAYYLFVNLVFTIPLIVTKYYCSFEILFVMKIMNDVMLILIFVATLLSFVGDMISNFKLVFTFQWIEYVFRKDPYYFRAQTLLFVPVMVYSLASEIYLLGSTQNFLGIIQNHEFYVITNTITSALIVLTIVLFPMLVTIIELLRSLCRKKTSGGLTDILNDSVVEERFTLFCEREFSLENLLLFKQVSDFKKSPSLELAQEIFSKYLNGAESDFEINISRFICDEVKAKISTGSINASLFSKVEGPMNSNLADTWSRFSYQSWYVNYMDSRKTQAELIEGAPRLNIDFLRFQSDAPTESDPRTSWRHLGARKSQRNISPQPTDPQMTTTRSEENFQSRPQSGVGEINEPLKLGIKDSLRLSSRSPSPEPQNQQ